MNINGRNTVKNHGNFIRIMQKKKLIHFIRWIRYTGITRFSFNSKKKIRPIWIDPKLNPGLLAFCIKYVCCCCCCWIRFSFCQFETQQKQKKNWKKSINKTNWEKVLFWEIFCFSNVYEKKKWRRNISSQNNNNNNKFLILKFKKREICYENDWIKKKEKKTDDENFFIPMKSKNKKIIIKFLRQSIYLSFF